MSAPSQTNSTATHSSQDVGFGSVDKAAAQDLKKLGYQQELTRSRGLLHILFMLLAIIAVPFGLGAPIATSLVGGGPAVMIWGWVLICFTSQPLALSLAEICSKYPTSAGAYYWCFQLTSPKRRLLSSWINGWLTMVGVWTISLSVNFGTAQILVAGVGIFKTDWVPTAWQTYLVFMAISIFSTLVGIFFNAILPLIDIACAIWTALGVVVMMVCLSAKAAVGRHSAAYVFGHFDPSFSGWTPGWSFFVGLLPIAYTFSAIGMVASMAEEVHEPTVQLPQAISWSIPISFVVGLIFLLPILFTLPDIPTLLAVPGGQPLGVLFELIMGSKGGGFGMWLIIFGIGLFCAISICCAASRATWSFARDKAIPFHSVWSKVNRSLGDVPVNANILSLTIQLLLGLIFLGSTAAFNAFVGVAVICLGASYAMPVAASLANGRRDMTDAPFNLGRWGYAINSFAVLWVAFSIVLFSMPAVIPVTKVSMNYASVVFVGFALISGVWYLINGRKNYHGPPIPDEDTDNVSSEQEIVSEKK
ncbi:amino acid transporter [Pholiota conissans]|uniref:Amino acid transporter n=1 Tax=Pholiota conissans TaxID=109636 RepID=A0A9P5YNW3_9AGAR|nr:amino acid transporter [Pholiota conissans]